MSIWLGWLGVGIGLAGCIAIYLMAFAISKPVEATGEGILRRRVQLVAGFALLLTVVFWAVAMQRRAPFSPGQTLGWGFLIGGVTGALADLLSFRLGLLSISAASSRPRRLAVHSIVFFSLFAVSLTYSIFHGYPQMALTGFAIGAVMATILYYHALNSEPALPGVYTEVWAVFGVSTAIGTVFAVQHFNQLSLRMWWSLPILLATTVSVASYVGTELGLGARLREKPGLSYSLSALTAVALVAGLSAIYSWRIVGDWRFLGVVAVGIGVAAIVAWLAASLNRGENRAAGLDVASASVLLVIAFVVACFKLWAGLGIALGLVAAWSVVLPALGSPELTGLSRALRGILSLGLVVLLFRLFIERYRSDLGSTDLQVHYTFVGAMLGAVLPFMFISSLARLKRLTDSDETGSTGIWMLLEVGSIGLVAAASPILLYLIWEMKAVLGFVFGLAAAVAFLLLVRLSDEREGSLFGSCSIALLAIGSQLAAVQFVGPLIELDLTRAARILILAAVVLVGVLWFAVTGILAARRAG